ncbi:MAG TPA: DUF1194 domain-containing protein [Geminicoccaceae bacterium]|nr:DUF1194 domain-containing protein [Geminicoccaceae bacterium]
MFIWFGRRAIAAILLVWPAAAGFAADKKIQTDANLVTALDVSDSIMRHEEWLEFEGLARAIVDPLVLDAIFSGRHGRIGFSVFAWSSGRVDVLVPWTVIASSGDAERVAAMLRGMPKIPRPGWARFDPRREPSRGGPGRRTDLSGSIDAAIDLASIAPHRAVRSIINVCANGRDNVGVDPRAARDRAVAAGMVVNGLAIGAKDGLADYFREHVQGGTGSFVLEVRVPAALVDAMVEKLLRDLVAARGPWPRPII